MQFKKRMAELVLNGTKTETRRTGKPRYKVGSRQPVQCGYRDKARGYIVIDEVYQQNEPVRKPSGLFRDVETGEYYQTSQPYEPGTLEVTKRKHGGKKRVVKIEEMEDCK